jgi:polysaccharide biosynthesis transport protein
LVSTRLKQQDSQNPALLPLSVIRMLWKRKIPILAMLAVLSAISAVVVFKLPAVYKSEALVLVDSQKIPEKFVSSTVSSGVADRLAAISQEIMSTTRLLKIIGDLDLYKAERKAKTQEEVVEEMRHDISVTVQKDNWATGKPVAFKVGYQGNAPTLVAEVANQLANLYIEENLQTREVEASGTSDFIDNQLSEAKRQLDDEEGKVAKFKQAHNGSLPEQESPLLSTLSNLRLQLQGIQDSLNRSQQNKLMMETALATEQSSEANLERALQMRSATGQPLAMAGDSGQLEDRSLPKLQHQLQEMESRYTPDHPDIIALKAEIAHMQQAQQGAAKELATASKAKAQPEAGPKASDAAAPISRDLLQERGKIAMMQTQLSGLKHDIDFEETERRRILQQTDALQARVEQLPIVEQEMVGLTRDYETSKANYKSLLDKQIAAQMSTDMERRQKSERFEIIDPARVPEKPFKPDRPLFLALGLIVSLAMALLVGFGLELRNPVLLGEWELPEHVVVLGRVPIIDMRPKRVAKSQGKLRAVAVGSAAACVLTAAVAYYFLKARL